MRCDMGASRVSQVRQAGMALPCLLPLPPDLPVGGGRDVGVRVSVRVGGGSGGPGLLLSLLHSRSQVGIGIAHDRECRHIQQNPWFARLHGLPLDSNISLSAPDTERHPIRYLDVHGRALPPEELPMQRAAATGQEVLDVELDLEVNGHRRGTLVISSVPLFDEEHCPRGCIGTIQDVTARKRAMEAQRFLAESSAALSSSLDQEQTSRTLVRLCVPALALVAAFCGWRTEGTLGMLSVTPADPALQPLADEVARAFAIPEGHPIHESMMTGRPRLIPVLEDVRGWYAAGDAQWRGSCQGLGVHSVMLIPLATPQGVAGVLVLGSTERTFTEDDFTFAKEYAAHATYAIDNARLYRDAREAVSLRDEFLGIAGHELRTPLTALRLGLQRLGRESTAPGEAAKLSKWVATCQRQGERLGRLVGDLLDVSRITSGRLPMVLEEMDLCALMEEVAARMGPELEKVGCRLVLKLQSPLPGRWDRSRLDQVLTNLLANAMKYGQGRPIEVSTRPRPRGCACASGTRASASPRRTRRASSGASSGPCPSVIMAGWDWGCGFRSRSSPSSVATSASRACRARARVSRSSFRRGWRTEGQPSTQDGPWNQEGGRVPGPLSCSSSAWSFARRRSVSSRLRASSSAHRSAPSARRSAPSARRSASSSSSWDFSSSALPAHSRSFPPASSNSSPSTSER